MILEHITSTPILDSEVGKAMLQQFWRLVDCNSVLLIHLVKLIDADL